MIKNTPPLLNKRLDTPTKSISISFEFSEAEKIKQAARDDSRSVSSYIRMAIKEKLEK